MGNVFDAMGQFWDEIASQNHTQDQISFLKTQLKPGSTILDLACGTGRHVIPLTQAGFCTVGLDVSRRLLKIAHQHGAKSLVLGDLRFLPFKKSAFAAAVSMDTSFGYLANESEDTHALTEAQRVLNQGGRLVLDIFNREHLTRKYRCKPSEPITLEYSNFVMIQKRSISISGDQLYDKWTLKKKSSGEKEVFDHTVHLYLYSDLEQMFATTGFRVDNVLGGYKSQPYSSDSPRLIFVASAL